MGQISNVLGLGSELEYKDKKYVLSPWTYLIQGQFERYLEFEAVKALNNMKAFLTEDEYRTELRQLRREITDKEYSFGSDRVAAALANPPHLRQLLFLMLKPNHPEVTLELAAEILVNELEHAYEAITAANPTTATEPTVTAEASPMTPPPSDSPSTS